VRWKRGEMLGQGAFGVVYLGLNVETGQEFLHILSLQCLSHSESFSDISCVFKNHKNFHP
jgi:hypothetical protein